jgi:hypothetical protein
MLEPSTGTALASFQGAPFVWTVGLSAWTVAYATDQKKRANGWPPLAK